MLRFFLFRETFNNLLLTAIQQTKNSIE